MPHDEIDDIPRQAARIAAESTHTGAAMIITCPQTGIAIATTESRGMEAAMPPLLASYDLWFFAQADSDDALDGQLAFHRLDGDERMWMFSEEPVEAAHRSRPLAHNGAHRRVARCGCVRSAYSGVPLSSHFTMLDSRKRQFLRPPTLKPSSRPARASRRMVLSDTFAIVAAPRTV
jgi:hypothetical protein